MRPTSCAGMVVLLALVIAVPAAPAAISVGQIPDKPSGVAAQRCDVGTFAVTTTSAPPRYEIPGDGVLTSWRTYTGLAPTQGPVRLKVIRPVSATTFKVVGAAAYIKPVYDLATNTGPTGRLRRGSRSSPTTSSRSGSARARGRRRCPSASPAASTTRSPESGS